MVDWVIKKSIIYVSVSFANTVVLCHVHTCLFLHQGPSGYIEENKNLRFFSETKGSCHVPVFLHQGRSDFIEKSKTPCFYSENKGSCHVPVSFFIRVRSTSSRRVKTRAFTARTRSAVSLTSSWRASASAAPRTCTRASSSTRK